MKKVYKPDYNQMIRLGISLSLIFFITANHSCKQNHGNEVKLIWKNDRATAIQIPLKILGEESDPDLNRLHIRMDGKQTNILGDFDLLDDLLFFTPQIPFTPRLNYKVFYKDRIIASFNVSIENKKTLQLTGIYPSTDTVPENLLKIYLQFNQPMQEHVAMDNISLVDDKSDTVENVFLDLKPELWNQERTILTIWLDPGRIKRDLIPNKQMGNPLVKGKKYTLVISGDWKNEKGQRLEQDIKKSFYVGDKDSSKISIINWDLKLPESGSLQALNISFDEPLDYYLLMECIQVKNSSGSSLSGKIKVREQQRGIDFIPDEAWNKGSYQIVVSPVLEDLAGNNLNRVFDRDLKTDKNAVQHLAIRSFTIQ